MSLICRRFSRKESRHEALPARGGPTAAGANALASHVIRHFVVFAGDGTKKPLAAQGSEMFAQIVTVVEKLADENVGIDNSDKIPQIFSEIFQIFGKFQHFLKHANNIYAKNYKC